MDDHTFQQAFREAKAATNWSHPAPWRCYVNVWAATHSKNLKGDLVECGVYKGFTSHLLCRMLDIDNTDKQFHLVDSYEGLDYDNLTDSERQSGLNTKNVNYHDLLPGVQKAFAKFKQARVVKGYVPQILPEVKAETVSYLHIDMNYMHPEIAAAEYFWERMVPGAVMVLDDYGFRKHIEQKLAFDEFATRRDTLVLPLPTGQGLIFKY
nr:class I SAM-dependent methyltransferase [Desulfocurvus vexinensis]